MQLEWDGTFDFGEGVDYEMNAQTKYSYWTGLIT